MLRAPRAVAHGGPGALLRTLLDQGTLRPLTGSGPGGVRGEITGTPVIAYAAAGALTVQDCLAVVDAVDAAVRERVPVIGVWHPGTEPFAGEVAALDAAGQVAAATVRASGRVPQLSVVLGPVTWPVPALTDLVITAGAGRPALGAPTGAVHAGSDTGAVAATRDLAVLLGRPGRISVDDVTDTDLGTLVPPAGAYDVNPLVDGLLDSPGTRLHAGWSPNVVTTLGRLGGRTVGVVASNPLRLGGCLDAAGAEKAARFVRMCDALGVPLVVLVDTPGHLPGLGQEQDGVLRRGAKLLHAFAEAVVPRVTLVTRHAGGSAYVAMNSRALGATAVLAWPDATITAPSLASPGAVGAGQALAMGLVDDVVTPARTRRRIATALARAPHARGAHSNIQL